MNKITRKHYKYDSINYLVNYVLLRRINRYQYKAFRDYNKGRINFMEFRCRLKYRRVIYEKNK